MNRPVDGRGEKQELGLKNWLLGNKVERHVKKIFLQKNTEKSAYLLFDHLFHHFCCNILSFFIWPVFAFNLSILARFFFWKIRFSSFHQKNSILKIHFRFGVPYFFMKILPNFKCPYSDFFCEHCSPLCTNVLRIHGTLKWCRRQLGRCF